MTNKKRVVSVQKGDLYLCSIRDPRSPNLSQPIMHTTIFEILDAKVKIHTGKWVGDSSPDTWRAVIQCRVLKPFELRKKKVEWGSSMLFDLRGFPEDLQTGKLIKVSKIEAVLKGAEFKGGNDEKNKKKRKKKI